MHIFEDNQSCIKCIGSESNCRRMKHIDIKLKFIYNVERENNIKIDYIPANIRISVLFMKALLNVRQN